MHYYRLCFSDWQCNALQVRFRAWRALNSLLLTYLLTLEQIQLQIQLTYQFHRRTTECLEWQWLLLTVPLVPSLTGLNDGWPWGLLTNGFTDRPAFIVPEPELLPDGAPDPLPSCTPAKHTEYTLLNLWSYELTAQYKSTIITINRVRKKATVF